MWGENVCFRIDEVWEPILEVSVTNFEIALHMEEIGCPPNWEAKGWGKRNRPWGFGRAPWHWIKAYQQTRFVGSLSCFWRVRCSRIYGVRQIDMASSQSAHIHDLLRRQSSSSVKQDRIITRRDQTRMRRPNIKDIKMRQNGNRSTWISDSLSQWKPPWLEVLSRGTSTQ